MKERVRTCRLCGARFEIVPPKWSQVFCDNCRATREREIWAISRERIRQRKNEQKKKKRQRPALTINEITELGRHYGLTYGQTVQRLEDGWMPGEGTP